MAHGLRVTNVHKDINMPKPRGKVEESTETPKDRRMDRKKQGHIDIVRQEYVETQAQRERERERERFVPISKAHKS